MDQLRRLDYELTRIRVTLAELMVTVQIMLRRLERAGRERPCRRVDKRRRRT